MTEVESSCPHFRFPSADERLEKDNILSLLSRRDFVGFRQSLKREHVHTEYAGKNSLLHYAVTSKDTASVGHVLDLGADVNAATAWGYTPLIVAVLHRYKWRFFFFFFCFYRAGRGYGKNCMLIHFLTEISNGLIPLHICIMYK